MLCIVDEAEVNNFSISLFQKRDETLLPTIIDVTIFDGFGAYLAVEKLELFADFVHDYEEAGVVTSVVLSF